MSGTELSRVRTELRLLPEPNNQRLLMSRGADIVMQSSGFEANLSPTCAQFGTNWVKHRTYKANTSMPNRFLRLDPVRSEKRANHFDGRFHGLFRPSQTIKH
jgi:hypothetical protein